MNEIIAKIEMVYMRITHLCSIVSTYHRTRTCLKGSGCYYTMCWHGLLHVEVPHMKRLVFEDRIVFAMVQPSSG